VFIPACRRCRFFGEIFLILFVDKVVPELLLLDCAAEPAPRGRDVRRRYNAGPSPGCLGQSQNWRLSLLLLLLLLLGGGRAGDRRHAQLLGRALGAPLAGL